MIIRPTGRRIQFERIPHPKPKPGEIVVPRPPSEECRVLAVGWKCHHIKKGDRVLISLRDGEAPIEGITGRLIHEDKVLAILS